MSEADLITNIVGNIWKIGEIFFNVIYKPFNWFTNLDPIYKNIIYFIAFLVCILILIYIIKNKDEIYYRRH